MGAAEGDFAGFDLGEFVAAGEAEFVEPFVAADDPASLGAEPADGVGVDRHVGGAGDADELRRSNTLLYGRVTYELMEGARRRPASSEWPDWMDAGAVAIAEVMDPMRKVVASTTLDTVEWNAALIPGDVGDAVRRLKEQPSRGIALGGVRLPMALAAAGLIDEYTFVVHPVIAVRGPRPLHGMELTLELVKPREFRSKRACLLDRACRHTRLYSSRKLRHRPGARSLPDTPPENTAGARFGESWLVRLSERLR